MLISLIYSRACVYMCIFNIQIETKKTVHRKRLIIVSTYVRALRETIRFTRGNNILMWDGMGVCAIKTRHRWNIQNLKIASVRAYFQNAFPSRRFGLGAVVPKIFMFSRADGIFAAKWWFFFVASCGIVTFALKQLSINHAVGLCMLQLIVRSLCWIAYRFEIGVFFLENCLFAKNLLFSPELL